MALRAHFVCAASPCHSSPCIDDTASAVQALSARGRDLKATHSLPIVAASEARMKRAEAREGMQLELQNSAVCTVAFSRGAERSVLFAVHGVPKVMVLGRAITPDCQIWTKTTHPFIPICPRLILNLTEVKRNLIDRGINHKGQQGHRRTLLM